MAAKSDKVIITCAITGSIHTPTMSDALPITPDQIAQQAIDAAKAGAAILHLHARDPKDGRPTGDPAVFRQFLPRIKQARRRRQHHDRRLRDHDGGRAARGGERTLARDVLAQHGLDEFRALSRWRRATRTGNTTGRSSYLLTSDQNIFRNTFRDIENDRKALGEGHGIKFEHECYDTGHLYNLAHCVDRGMFKPPIFLQLIFGILGGIGADVDNLMFMKRTADRLFGNDYLWSVLGARPLPDHVCHPGRDDGRQRARGARGQALYRPRASSPRAMPSRSRRCAAWSRSSAIRLPPRRRRGRCWGSRAPTG